MRVACSTKAVVGIPRHAPKHPGMRMRAACLRHYPHRRHHPTQHQHPHFAWPTHPGIRRAICMPHEMQEQTKSPIQTGTPTAVCAMPQVALAALGCIRIPCLVQLDILHLVQLGILYLV